MDYIMGVKLDIIERKLDAIYDLLSNTQPKEEKRETKKEIKEKEIKEKEKKLSEEYGFDEEDDEEL
jgi:hypothetical protein